MQYNNVTTLDGVIQYFEMMTDLGSGYISGDTTRLKEVTAIVNRVNHRIWHSIFMSSGNWQYDDGNHTDMPFATTNIVSGQSQYALPSDALTVKRLEYKDQNGNWNVLKPLLVKNINEAIDEYNDVNGDPIQYTMINGQIKLYPAPDYSQDASLQAYFDRDSVDFAYDDTTTTLGFASPYHELSPIKASIEWLKIKQPTSPTLGLLMQDDLRIEKSMIDYYSKRFKDYTPKITRIKELWK